MELHLHSVCMVIVHTTDLYSIFTCKLCSPLPFQLTPLGSETCGYMHDQTVLPEAVRT